MSTVFHISSSLIEEVGVEEAIFLDGLSRLFHFKAINGTRAADGRVWVWTHDGALNERVFPFWSRKTIMRIRLSLVERGILLSGTKTECWTPPDGDVLPNTTWLAFADEKCWHPRLNIATASKSAKVPRRTFKSPEPDFQKSRSGLLLLSLETPDQTPDQTPRERSRTPEAAPPATPPSAPSTPEKGTAQEGGTKPKAVRPPTPAHLLFEAMKAKAEEKHRLVVEGEPSYPVFGKILRKAGSLEKAIAVTTAWIEDWDNWTRDNIGWDPTYVLGKWDKIATKVSSKTPSMNDPRRYGRDQDWKPLDPAKRAEEEAWAPPPDLRLCDDEGIPY